MAGFTGEVWQRIPAEQLARELMTGVGPTALFESGVSWMSISAELSDLAGEVAQLSKHLGDSWQGDGGDSMTAAVRKLLTWLTETAEMAGRNAKAAETQALATTIARTTMPQADEVAQLTDLHNSMSTLSFPAGSVLGGGMAFVETSLHLVKAQAARVMETYEQATTPVAAAWAPVEAPVNLVKTVARVKKPDATSLAVGDSGGGLAPAMLAAIAALNSPFSRSGQTSEYIARNYTTSASKITATVEEAAIEQVHTAPAPMMGPVAATPTSAPSTHLANSLNLTTTAEGENVVAPEGTQAAAPSVFGATEGVAT